MEDDEMSSHGVELFPRFDDVEDIDGPSVVGAFHLHPLLPPRHADQEEENDNNEVGVSGRRVQDTEYGQYNEEEEAEECVNDHNDESMLEGDSGDEVERAAIRALQEAAAVDPQAIHDALRTHAAEPFVSITPPLQLQMSLNAFREDTTDSMSTNTMDAAAPNAQLAMMTAAVATTGMDHLDKTLPNLVPTSSSAMLMEFLQKASLKHKTVRKTTRNSQTSSVEGRLGLEGPIPLCSCTKTSTNSNCVAHGMNTDRRILLKNRRDRLCTADGCSKKPIRYGFCSGHGGRAKCKISNCEKYDRGQGKCKAHGGGYPCKIDGCHKKDRGRGFCTAHGGGKKCSIDGCMTACVGGGRCKLHGGGRRCTHEGCMNWALNLGKCKEHGATGPRCSFTNCERFDQGGGYCLTHGGGYKCIVPECDKKGVRFGRCCAHGGKPRCSIENCDRMAQRKGLCKGHGGYTLCEVDGCPRRANGGRRCINHGGGGLRCKAEGCDKTNRGGGFCKAHGGGKRCVVSDCKEWAIGGGQCAQHALFSTATTTDVDLSIV